VPFRPTDRVSDDTGISSGSDRAQARYGHGNADRGADRSGGRPQSIWHATKLDQIRRDTDPNEIQRQIAQDSTLDRYSDTVPAKPAILVPSHNSGLNRPELWVRLIARRIQAYRQLLSNCVRLREIADRRGIDRAEIVRSIAIIRVTAQVLRAPRKANAVDNDRKIRANCGMGPGDRLFDATCTGNFRANTIAVKRGGSRIGSDPETAAHKQIARQLTHDDKLARMQNASQREYARIIARKEEIAQQLRNFKERKRFFAACNQAEKLAGVGDFHAAIAALDISSRLF
jgi:hypothetical protein